MTVPEYSYWTVSNAMQMGGESKQLENARHVTSSILGGAFRLESFKTGEYGIPIGLVSGGNIVEDEKEPPPFDVSREEYDIIPENTLNEEIDDMIDLDKKRTVTPISEDDVMYNQLLDKVGIQRKSPTEKRITEKRITEKRVTKKRHNRIKKTRRSPRELV
jgi:hypothetical protein